MKKIFLYLFLIPFTACTFSPVAPKVDPVQEPFVKNEFGAVTKNPVLEFNETLLSNKIILSKEETELIKKYKETNFFDKWISTETDSSEFLLENNFFSFKSTFKPVPPANKTEYFQNAINFANSANLYARYYFDVKYYSSRNKILVIKWDIQTKEFIAVYLDGRVSNYQISDNIKSPRYILIPESY